MSTTEIVLLVLILLFSVISFVIAFFQFKEKGFLFNNSYIYASKEERNNMNKKPYYQQSAIAFSAVGIMFIMTAIAIIIGWKLLFPIIIIFSVLLIIYAVISSVIIEGKRK